MEQNLKELLIKELCSRLPYSLMVKRPDDGTPDYLSAIDIEAGTLMVSYNGYTDEIEKFVPYLRPMSSMTEEEKHKLLKFGAITCLENGEVIDVSCVGFERHADVQDYLNAHHFDYRNLIEKGLALELPEGMYNLNEKTMVTITEGDKVRIHSSSKELYDNKIGKVLNVWDLDKNPWGNIVVKIEGDNYQNCFLEKELELLKD